MWDAIEKRSQENQAHIEAFKCSHDHQELRKRTVKGGAIQFVDQCLRCGSATSQPLSRAKALEQNGGVEPPPFDEQKLESWKKAYNQGFIDIQARYSARITENKTEFRDWYGTYLGSPEWETKRQKVFKRANQTCEGCGERPATEVHHLSYDNVGDELLFQLVALCDTCHTKVHPEHVADEEPDL